MKKLPAEDLEYIYQNTQDIWESFRGKSIFLTGGTGFFGKWILNSFIYINQKLKLNAKLIVLTRNKIAFYELFPDLLDRKEVSFIQGDICTFDFPEEKIDYIIHAATEASVKLNLELPLVMFNTVVNGTKRVLDLAVIKNVKSLLFTSSGAVYGNQPDFISHIEEIHNGAPELSNSSSVYGEAKRMAEVLCSVYYEHKKVSVKIARCFAFVGPYLPLDSTFAVGNFIHNVLNKEDIVIKGDGSNLRSYMYASDLTVWIWIILFKGESNFPYNIGSDLSISIKELALLIKSCTNSMNLNIKITDTEKKSNNYVPSIYRAKNGLNLTMGVDLETAILKTVDFYS
jgi:nucleoside-diphosphate-sugar epimerase